MNKGRYIECAPAVSRRPNVSLLINQETPTGTSPVVASNAKLGFLTFSVESDAELEPQNFTSLDSLRACNLTAEPKALGTADPPRGCDMVNFKDLFTQKVFGLTDGASTGFGAFKAIDDGAYGIQVPAGVLRDVLNSTSTASNVMYLNVDSAPPEISVNLASATQTSSNVTIDIKDTGYFGKCRLAKGLSQSDVVFNTRPITGLQRDGPCKYSFEFDAGLQKGPFDITVLAGAVADSSGNPS